MKYYTQCQAYPEGQPFVFKVWLDYDEAIDNVHMLFRLCDIRHIDIVEHTTNKVFITLHKLDVIPKQTNHISKKSQCTV